MAKFRVVLESQVRREYLVDAADETEARRKADDEECRTVCGHTVKVISISELQ